MCMSHARCSSRTPTKSLHTNRKIRKILFCDIVLGFFWLSWCLSWNRKDYLECFWEGESRGISSQEEYPLRDKYVSVYECLSLYVFVNVVSWQQHLQRLLCLLVFPSPLASWSSPSEHVCAIPAETKVKKSCCCKTEEHLTPRPIHHRWLISWYVLRRSFKSVPLTDNAHW